MPAFDLRLLPKCHDRLDKARRALFECRNASSDHDLLSAWASLLVSGVGVIHAIEAGSRGTPQGRQWMGKVRRDGRNDPLVSYMHQARNDEEHEADPAIVRPPNLPLCWVDPETGEFTPFFDGNEFDYGNPKLSEDGRAVTFGRYRRIREAGKRRLVIGRSVDQLALRPLTDQRFKTVFLPPLEHQGKRVDNLGPVEIAELFVRYLEDLVDEAASIS